MGFFKKIFNFFSGGSSEPTEKTRSKTPRERVEDSRTSIPADAKIEIVKTWSPVNGGHPGRFKAEPWRGWKDDDILDEDQVLVHVTSASGGVDYYRTLMGPFADNAIDSIMDLISAEFWNSSP